MDGGTQIATCRFQTRIGGPFAGPVHTDQRFKGVQIGKLLGLRIEPANG